MLPPVRDFPATEMPAPKATVETTVMQPLILITSPTDRPDPMVDCSHAVNALPKNPDEHDEMDRPAQIRATVEHAPPRTRQPSDDVDDPAKAPMAVDRDPLIKTVSDELIPVPASDR